MAKTYDDEFKARAVRFAFRQVIWPHRGQNDDQSGAKSGDHTQRWPVWRRSSGSGSAALFFTVR